MAKKSTSLERPWHKRNWYRLTQTACRTISRFYLRLRSQGRSDIPRTGPAVLVCNHASHLDPLMVGILCPRQICYLARDTLFRGPLGWLIRSYDAIPVDREGSGLAGIRATLKRIKQGDAVLLFPEGARTYDGQLQPMQPGFLALVRRGKAALVPVGIDGSFEAMPRGVAIPRPKRVAVVFGETIPFERLSAMEDKQLLDLVARSIADCRDEAASLNGR